MKTMKLAKLKKQWNEVCTEYATKFANKQDLEFEGWIGDEVGGIICVGDYFFNLTDVVYDINSKQPKGLILQWHNESIEAHLKKLDTAGINYFSYTKGMQFK